MFVLSPVSMYVLFSWVRKVSFNYVTNVTKSVIATQLIGNCATWIICLYMYGYPACFLH